MSLHTLKRTGKAPLSFEGERIAHQQGQWANGKEQNRWHNLSLYKTAGGKYVLHIEWVTHWKGEVSKDEAIVFDSVEAVGQALQAYNPRADVQGFPPLPQYAERQGNLLSWVETRFRNQVSTLLQEVPTAAERID